MEEFSAWVGKVSDLVWGPYMLALIVGTGVYLTVRLKLLQFRFLGYALKQSFSPLTQHEGKQHQGDVSHFGALMTALSATIGTGNIAGVATAVVLGGPGAVFWMWMTALVGMATKYAEVLLAVHYRETDDRGEQVGGPMYAIKNGLGRHWRWLGAAFAIFGGLAGFGIGNMVQSNSIAGALDGAFGIDPWISGIVMAVCTGFVLLGGVKRIGAVAEKLVPFMCVGYVVASLIVLGMYADQIPGAFVLIIDSAFSPVAATGGFAGAAVMMAIRYGVARGIFSNEAGLGTAGIAQAAGQTKNPVESGLVGMMGTFIDTIIVCTMTALVLIVTGVWNGGLKGAALTAAGFDAAFPGFGGQFLAIAITIFAFTTILGWAYYGEKCWEYLIGTSVEVPYRVVWTLFVLVGAVTQLDFVWLVADTLNAFMALPNLISLLLLSPVVVRLTREYWANYERDRKRAGTPAGQRS